MLKMQMADVGSYSDSQGYQDAQNIKVPPSSPRSCRLYVFIFLVA